MRTTIDFSDEMFRKLKAYAAMKGMSLRELVQKAVKSELAGGEEFKVADGPMKKPEVTRVPIKITGAELADLFRTIPKPDPEYWDDVEEAIRHQPPAEPPHEHLD